MDVVSERHGRLALPSYGPGCSPPGPVRRPGAASRRSLGSDEAKDVGSLVGRGLSCRSGSACLSTSEPERPFSIGCVVPHGLLGVVDPRKCARICELFGWPRVARRPALLGGNDRTHCFEFGQRVRRGCDLLRSASSPCGLPVAIAQPVVDGGRRDAKDFGDVSHGSALVPGAQDRLVLEPIEGLAQLDDRLQRP
jgi:hypothetical protein